MRLFGRGAELPAEVRAAVRGRPLASARAEDGTWLVGTRDALFVVGDDPVCLRWERVLRGDWDQDTSTLTVERVEEYGEPTTAWSFVLPEPGGLVPLLRERVSASVLLQRRVPIEKKRGLIVIARRPPAGGTVTWAYQFDRGIDTADPDVAAAAEEALRDAQESLGLL
ncbi:hypothetical protein [Nocardioides caldifontis]|uniref:hypothetical protein n=1 Tax=Nocardioides caldifontis TaxID=2588938 RepID=UPI0011DF8508|nr:hypothetical protein [Nocardioides caldifontis]